MHVRQAALDAVVIEAEPLVIEAEQVQERGVQVVDCRDVLHRFVAELVDRTETEAAFDAGAGETDGEARKTRSWMSRAKSGVGRSSAAALCPISRISSSAKIASDAAFAWIWFSESKMNRAPNRRRAA
jgi:hypothetical protein